MAFKDWWKAKPYWLKGGIITVFISLMCFILFLFFEWLEDFISISFLGIFHSIIGIIAFPIGLGGWAFIWGDNGPPTLLSSGLIQFILGLVFWFIIGTIIGWIIGKIKSRKQ